MNGCCCWQPSPSPSADLGGPKALGAPHTCPRRLFLANYHHRTNVELEGRRFPSLNNREVLKKPNPPSSTVQGG